MSFIILDNIHVAVNFGASGAIANLLSSNIYPNLAYSLATGSDHIATAKQLSKYSAP